MDTVGFARLGLLAFAASAAYIIIGGIVNYRKLPQFKGPPLAAFSRIWLFWQTINKRRREALIAAHERYGPMVRIGPNLLLTNDPEIIHHASAPGSKWTRGPFHDAMRLDPRMDSVFSTRDEKLHSKLRAAEIGGYNGKNIENLESSIDERVIELLELIKQKYSGTILDIAKAARFFTLDVLSTVAFGAKFGFMEADGDLWDYNKINEDFMLFLTLTTDHPWIHWITSTSIMQFLAAPKVTDKKGLGPALAFAQRAVAERFGESPKQRRDMLGHFVENGLSQAQCEVESFLQIIAGSDSTTTVVRSTMFLLASNPDAYSKLRAEIDQAVRDGAASRPVVTYAEAQKLPYLVACIWEGLRMYPPLFGLKSKMPPQGGEQVKGYFFPEGVELANMDYAYTRSRKTFGDDADFFRPDRWIEASREDKIRYRYAVDTVFGTGRFQCLGRHIAFIELHKVFFELVQSFDWAIADPMQPIEFESTSVLFQRRMNMIARPR